MEQSGGMLLPVCTLLLALFPMSSAVPIRYRGNWAKPDYSIYHSMEKLLSESKNIVEQNRGIMQMDTAHAGEPGYEIDMQVITVEPGGLSKDHSKKIRILLDFGEHARELVSSETGLRLLRILAEGDEAVRRVTGDFSNQVLNLLPHTVFKILPMENTRGRYAVEHGDLCERKNGRGVDPNRNWEVDWGVKEKDYDPKEEYPGKHPFSEPEAQIVRDIVREWRPLVWVNVHSGMEALFMPFDHRAEIPQGPAGLAQLGILKHLNKLVCGDRCAVGSGGKSVGYLAHGTATDHMYLKENVPLSFTWEIYGDAKAHYLDCFRMFNPLTREHLDSVVSAWAPGFLYLLALLPSHPAAEALMAEAGIPLPAQEAHRPERLLDETHGMAVPEKRHSAYPMGLDKQRTDVPSPQNGIGALEGRATVRLSSPASSSPPVESRALRPSMKILKTHLSSVVRVRQWWMFPLGLVSVALPFVAAAALIRWMPHRWRRWLRAIRGAGDRESLEGRSK